MKNHQHETSVCYAYTYEYETYLFFFWPVFALVTSLRRFFSAQCYAQASVYRLSVRLLSVTFAYCVKTGKQTYLNFFTTR